MLKRGIKILKNEGLEEFISRSASFGYERVRNPRRTVSKMNSWYHTLGQEFNDEGVDVFAEDWDNLLFLDACRYDYFGDSIGDYAIDGTLESRTSKAAGTNRWLKANFHDRDLSDVVYVTSGSNLYQLTVNDQIDANLHKVIDVWQEQVDYKNITILPETMNEYAREAIEKYPDKRLVVRYMQPHTPFLGDVGETIEFEDNNFTWDNKIEGRTDVDDESVREAYQETLDRGLEAIEAIVDDLPGKTVITADHGQLLGDTGSPIPISDWGHPPGLYVEDLVKVPWFVVSNNGRREIRKGKTEEYRKKEEEEVTKKAKEHLKNLGYM